MKKVKSRKPTAKATRLLPASRPGGKKSAKRTAKRSRAAAKRSGKPREGRATSVGRKAQPDSPGLTIRELDPIRICGGRTSVVQLFRVDEQLVAGRAAGARQVHLVFNDRHGWYCEHGRSCHAVSAVMRHARIR